MRLFSKKGIYASMPSVCAYKDSLITAFRNAPEEKPYSHLHSLSSITIVRSLLSGKILDIKTVAEEDDAAKQDPCLYSCENGRIYCFYFRYLFHPQNEYKNLIKDKSLVVLNAKSKKTLASLRTMGYVYSDDGGNSFSSPHKIKIEGVSSFAMRGGLIENGTKILMGIYAVKKRSEKYACCLAEFDKESGKCSIISEIAKTSDTSGKIYEYFEPSLLRFKNNIHAFIRTHEKTKKGYKNGFISHAFSNNEGKTFSLKHTEIQGYPAYAIEKENSVFLFYGKRVEPFGVGVRVYSDLSFNTDLGEAGEVLIEGKSESADCGYPWAVLAKNDIFLVYYMHLSSNRRVICLKKYL